VALPAAGALAALFAAVWTLMLASSDRAFTEGMQTADPAVRERLLRESLEANPRAWRSHYELARTFSATMRFPQAAEEGKATLALRPHHVDALNQTAICRFRSGVESAEAERDLKHAIEVAPYYYKSYFNLGIAEGLRGAFAESRRRLTESIERNPRHAPSYYYRGSAWVASGDLNLALEDCRKAKALGFDVAGALKADHAALEKDARFAELFK
jgi:tetratricopeptide (TPR) repeat protein